MLVVLITYIGKLDHTTACLPIYLFKYPCLFATLVVFENLCKPFFSPWMAAETRQQRCSATAVRHFVAALSPGRLLKSTTTWRSDAGLVSTIYSVIRIPHDVFVAVQRICAWCFWASACVVACASTLLRHMRMYWHLTNCRASMRGNEGKRRVEAGSHPCISCKQGAIAYTFASRTGSRRCQRCVYFLHGFRAKFLFSFPQRKTFFYSKKKSKSISICSIRS